MRQVVLFFFFVHVCAGFVLQPRAVGFSSKLYSSLDMQDAISRIQALSALLQKIRKDEPIEIKETLNVIESLYEYSPVAFSIGDQVNNKAGENEGSAKILSFAKLSGLEVDMTLRCFGAAYQDVLNDPQGDSHQNIRALMNLGLDAVQFPNGFALSPRQAEGPLPTPPSS